MLSLVIRNVIERSVITGVLVLCFPAIMCLWLTSRRSHLAPAIMCPARHGSNRFPTQNAALYLQQYTFRTVEVISYIFGDFSADG